MKDKIGRARIAHRIWASEHGNCEAVSEGVSVRVYFTQRGEVIYLLLLGSQKRDIKRAIEMEDANPDVFHAAVRDVAHARGMAQLAKDADLGGENLHKLLSPGVKLHYDTMLKLLHVLGIKLAARPVALQPFG